MSTAIIIIVCVLVLIAYLFDLTANKTKIPSVILLLILGAVLKYITNYFKIEIPYVDSLLNILGTLGLILIVLDGSLELDFSVKKVPLIKKSLIVAIIPMFIFIFGLTLVLFAVEGGSFRKNVINVIPLSVISSAIAIPTVRMLGRKTKEFIVFESSLSDIVGVLLFNFFALNHVYGIAAFAHEGFQILVILLISFVATIVLTYMMNKIEHHIKFIPIILILFLIYAITKVFHLSGLIFILVFGLFLGNIEKLEKISWFKRLNIDSVNKEISKFKDLVVEATFLVRSVFFILFGFTIDVKDLFNQESSYWAFGITAGIFGLRSLFLYLNKLPQFPLLFIAPRGLITILLYINIDEVDKVPLINNPLLIQIIVLTALIMMFGMMLTTNTRKKRKKRLSQQTEKDLGYEAIEELEEDANDGY